MAIAGSDEILRKISSQIDSQFPGFIREEGPQFVSFMKAYFEYMEQSGNAIDATRSIRDNIDIDRTVDSFVEYFRKEFMISIPKTTLADKRLLTKHIKEFYRTKGSQESYRFLFRALYGQEIDFYYPGDDILRASDGRWVRETLLRVAAPFSVNPNMFDGKRIRGIRSGATAFVQNIISTEASGIVVYDLYVDNVSGVFIDGERVVDVENTNNYVTVNSSAGSITEISVLDGGAFHNLNDIIEISGAGSTENATGAVSEVTNKSAVTLKLVKGGSGYTKENTRLVVTGGNGKNFSVKIQSWTKEAIAGGASINTDLIAPMKNVPINAARFFAEKGQNTSPISTKLTGTVKLSLSSNTVVGQGTNFTSQLSVGSIVRVKGSANTLRVHSISSAQTFISAQRPLVNITIGANAYIGLAGANAYTRLSSALTFSTTEFYSVNAITLINPGYGYTTLPTIKITDSFMTGLNISDGYGGVYGNNAVVIANNTPGTIAKVRIVSKGSNFNKYDPAQLFNLSQSNAAFTESQSGSRVSGAANTKYLIRKKTYSGAALAKPSGFIQLPGRYIDTKGFLSWNNKLQDNFYYQEFSYVIRVNEVITKYRNIIKSLLHPAGTALFGDYVVRSSIALPFVAVDETPSIARGIIRESISADAQHSAITTFATANFSESVTVLSNQDGTFNANTARTESVTANQTAQGQRFTLMSGVYAKVLYANNVIQSYSALSIQSYSAITVGTFDGTPRLVIGTLGSPKFANGAIKANTGSISVAGPGSNLYIVTVPGTPNSSSIMYQVNSIFSNTTFTLRTNYTPTTANARIWYSTGP
jgi:hypothetical protein